TGNIYFQPALLMPLGLYGGETEIRPPLPTSPAVYAGRPTVSGELDQRGLDRGEFGITDIGAVHPRTMTVDNPGDSGPGTLRDAWTQPTALPDPVRIRFAISEGGVTTIQPLPIGGGVALPVITNRIFLDGWSAGGNGYQGAPLVEIDGSMAPGTFGLN